MDCISEIESEHARFAARSVTLNFHIAVIRQAISYVRQGLAASAVQEGVFRQEAVAACDDALESLAQIQSGPAQS